MSDVMVPKVCFGVGIDTARYGHYASFLDEDRQEATRGFTFMESREGYEKLQATLVRLAARHGGNVDFHIRIDAAGQYAVNLEAFLRRLPFSKIISIGDPKRNKDYKNAHFPKRKADPVDSLACARFAIVERPKATAETKPEFLPLRDLAGALQAQRKQTTRRVNQLHNHLSRVFPELDVLAADISAEWVLKLLEKYPVPQQIAEAGTAALEQIPHITRERAQALQAAARSTTGSLRGEPVAQLIRHLVAEVNQSRCAERTLAKALEQAYGNLPEGGHQQLLTIPGIGPRTAAALAAKIISIDRFKSAEALVSYFGTFPEENTSGVDKQGMPVARGTTRMSSKGNDLVRGLLWMACQSAIQCNPVIRELYARQRAAGKRGDVALGHCMRKMLHLVFAVWTTNRPFDPKYAGPPAQEPQTDTAAKSSGAEQAAPVPSNPVPSNAEEAPAGRKGQSPDEKAVTAAGTHLATRKIPQDAAGGKQSAPTSPDGTACCRSPRVDFAHVRRQISMTDVLHHLGVLDRLHGQGPQRRGPCPIHEPQDNNGRTFSVNLVKHVFRCLDPRCNAQGNVLDLWAAVHHLPLRDAALHLARTFHLSTHDHEHLHPQESHMQTK